MKYPFPHPSKDVFAQHIEIDLDGDSFQEVLNAVQQIQNKYPDAQAKDIRILFDFGNDKNYLSYDRVEPNPTYEQEMVDYLREKEHWEKDQKITRRAELHKKIDKLEKRLVRLNNHEDKYSSHIIETNQTLDRLKQELVLL